jgi:hypothetical protein
MPANLAPPIEARSLRGRGPLLRVVMQGRAMRAIHRRSIAGAARSYGS